MSSSILIRQILYSNWCQQLAAKTSCGASSWRCLSRRRGSWCIPNFSIEGVDLWSCLVLLGSFSGNWSSGSGVSLFPWFSITSFGRFSLLIGAVGLENGFSSLFILLLVFFVLLLLFEFGREFFMLFKDSHFLEEFALKVVDFGTVCVLFGTLT